MQCSELVRQVAATTVSAAGALQCSTKGFSALQQSLQSGSAMLAKPPCIALHIAKLCYATHAIPFANFATWHVTCIQPNHHPKQLLHASPYPNLHPTT
jgi:hypothetical protein